MTKTETAEAVPGSQKVELIEAEDKRTGINTDANYRVVLQKDDRWQNKIRYNTMANTIEVDGKEITDPTLYDISEWMLKRYGLSGNVVRVRGALNAVAQEHRYSPVATYLNKNYGLNDYDGTEAIDSLPAMLSSDQSKLPLYRKYLRKWLVGAVMRALEPGAEFEGMLVLSGPQNIGKTSFLQILGGEWWSDAPIIDDNKDSLIALHKCWIHEDGELAAQGAFRANKLKAMLTRRFDDLRLPYAATQPRMQRGFVFSGTTNRDDFLDDFTGNRRFWIIDRNVQLDREKLIMMRDRIWYEAMDMYLGYKKVRNGEADTCFETPYLDSHEVETDTAEHNRDFNTQDPWEDSVVEFAATKSQFTITELLIKVFDFRERDIGRKEQLRASEILRKKSYKNKTYRCPDGKIRRYWTRHDVHEQIINTQQG